MGGEPVNPWEHEHQVMRRWRNGHVLPAWQIEYVILGRLADGRWYVELVSRVPQCRAYPDQGTAERVADRVMADRGRQWHEVPDRGV